MEKKIIASERNQPRIYLTKQEVQQFDLARPVSMTLEQDDYVAVDAIVIELFNEKLRAWFEQQSTVQSTALEDFVRESLIHHQFQEVARTEENCAFARKGKYINVHFPVNVPPSLPACGFDEQIEWVKTASRALPRWSYNVDFEGIMTDLFAGGLIKSGLVARENGQILYISNDWSVQPEDVKECFYDWHHHAQRIKLNKVQFSMTANNQEYFLASNAQDKTWLVGAASLPDKTGERYYVLGTTSEGTNPHHAYMDIVRAAGRMKEEGQYNAPVEGEGKQIALIKPEYEVIAVLEKQLGVSLPVVKKVDHNTFGFIPSDKHVVALGLYDKNLTYLPDAFWDLKFLRTLSLARNRLKELSENLGNVTQLETLWLQDNKLESLPAGVGHLKSLKTLNLWKNKLISLPDAIGECAALEDLRVDNNKLIALPDNLGNLTALKKLDANTNKLAALPASMGGLKALQVLDLRYNALASLPESIGGLGALKDLRLMTNQLTTLPQSIGQLAALQVLNVADNWISTLPDSLRGMDGLKEIYLASNRLPPGQVEEIVKALEQYDCVSDLSFELPTKSKYEDKVIQAADDLWHAKWDEAKKEEILAMIKAAGDVILNSPRIRDIRYALTQSSVAYQDIAKWRAMDESRPTHLRRIFNEIQGRLDKIRDIIYPAVREYLKESIHTKSEKFQKTLNWNGE